MCGYSSPIGLCMTGLVQIGFAIYALNQKGLCRNKLCTNRLCANNICANGLGTIEACTDASRKHIASTERWIYSKPLYDLPYRL